MFTSFRPKLVWNKTTAGDSRVLTSIFSNGQTSNFIISLSPGQSQDKQAQKCKHTQVSKSSEGNKTFHKRGLVCIVLETITRWARGVWWSAVEAEVSLFPRQSRLLMKDVRGQIVRPPKSSNDRNIRSKTIVSCDLHKRLFQTWWKDLSSEGFADHTSKGHC